MIFHVFWPLFIGKNIFFLGVKCRLDGEHYTLPISAIPCSYDFDPYLHGCWEMGMFFNGEIASYVVHCIQYALTNGWKWNCLAVTFLPESTMTNQEWRIHINGAMLPLCKTNDYGCVSCRETCGLLGTSWTSLSWCQIWTIHEKNMRKAKMNLFKMPVRSFHKLLPTEWLIHLVVCFKVHLNVDTI